MKKTNCIIIALAAITALLTFVGCSTNTNTAGSTTGASGFAAKKSGGVSALSLTPGAKGGFNETGGTVGCVGTYTGSAKITNSETGTIWFTAPTGATNCVITDSSGFSSPYVSVVQATRRSNGAMWCGTNTLSFPVVALQQYRFCIYTKSTPPPPTNGQVLTLDVEWNP